VGDSLFRRRGRGVYGAAWQHDGSAPGKGKVGFGTCFVTAGIIVALPFCVRPVCLPVLARLHVPSPGKKPARAARRDAVAGSRVSQAAALVTVLAAAFPGRAVHVVADAAYHGPALRGLPAAVTWTTRLPRNAVLSAPAPPRVRKPGRPPRKGPRLGTPADLAAAACWTPATAHLYGRDQATSLAEVTCLWYGCLDTAAVRVILARHNGTVLALVSTARPATGPAAPSSAPSRSPCSSTPWSSPGTPGTATTPPTSPPAARTSPGTPPRPSPPSKTCSPSSAAPSSPPAFAAVPQLSPNPHKSEPSWQPGTPPPHNCETPATLLRGETPVSLRWAGAGPT